MNNFFSMPARRSGSRPIQIPITENGNKRVAPEDPYNQQLSPSSPTPTTTASRSSGGAKRSTTSPRSSSHQKTTSSRTSTAMSTSPQATTSPRSSASTSRHKQRATSPSTSPPPSSLTTARIGGTSEPTGVSETRQHKRALSTSPPRVASPDRSASSDATLAYGVGKGLQNRVGENNCFLNVCIQTLYYIPEFRSALDNASSRPHRVNRHHAAIFLA